MNKMDLFTPRFKEERLHPYFKSLIMSKEYKPVQDTLTMWSIGLLGRKKESNKFINEFQLSFNSSFWELYLNKAFLDMGFHIDYSKESPDFNLTHDSGRVINVEAVSSNNKLNETKDYYTKSAVKKSLDSKKENFDFATLKLLGKIKDKKDIFIGSNGKKFPYSSLEHVDGNPFVIAIAPFDSHHSYTQNNTLINRVLFGIEPPTINENKEPVSNKISHIINNNGESIELGIFTNDSYKEISAVIFSTTGTFGKAVVQSNVKNTKVRSTRYRESDLGEFISNHGLDNFGTTERKLSKTHDIISTREPYENKVSGSDSNFIVYGSDIHYCDLSEHEETHLDGLHIYYNPYANIPLDNDLFNNYEITQNYFDKTTREMIPIHNDNSLVSRQVFTEQEPKY
ncbi:MAG: hypothetical protein NTY39_04790 [Campylobacterales bacterium]|nr:hypothetical protein [Campylobacterales bacterium]